MGHNLVQFSTGLCTGALRGENWAILGKTGLFFGETGLFLEIGAIGDRAPAGTWCSRGRSRTPRARRFRTCFAISRFGRLAFAEPIRRESKQGEINYHDGGRGVYFEDLNGRLLEIITRPYGSNGWNP